MIALRETVEGGFTLMELILTVLVVSVLLILSLAGISTGLQKVRAAKCLQNLRQIGALIPLYAQDHRGLMPPCSLNASTVLWYRELYPYINISDLTAGQSIFACPAKKAAENSGHSYGIEYNATLGPGATPNIRLASLQTPGSLTPVALGERWLVIDASWYFIQLGAGSADPAKATRLRHSHRANVLMYDFSVKAMAKDEINAALYLYKSYPLK